MVNVSDDITGEVTVILRSDGSRELRLLPPYASPLTAELLREAAEILAGSAEIAEREKLPVACPTCGETARGVIADATGSGILRPCGHTVE
jgi:hypothetical protein